MSRPSGLLGLVTIRDCIAEGGELSRRDDAMAGKACRAGELVISRR